MYCSEIKKLLEKYEIKTLDELNNALEIYSTYKKYDISSKKDFENTLTNQYNSDKYLNWNYKIDFIRKKLLKNISKDLFAKDLSIELKKYLDKTNDEFDINDRKNISKSKFDREYGYKTEPTIRQSLKLTNSLIHEYNIKEAYEKESQFIENLCNIYNISLEWFMNKMYKTPEELNNTHISEVKAKLIDFGINIKETEKQKILEVINKSVKNINIEIKQIIGKEDKSLSKEFYFILLQNSFNRNFSDEKSFSRTLLELIDLIEKLYNDNNYSEEILLTKVKLLSNLEEDENAIQLIEENIDIDNINLESHLQIIKNNP